MKICVYAIAKNEEKFVDRWVHSMREADYICVLDTGSTDATVELLADRETLAAMSRNLEALARSDAAEDIVNEIVKVMK